MLGGQYKVQLARACYVHKMSRNGYLFVHFVVRLSCKALHSPIEFLFVLAIFFLQRMKMVRQFNRGIDVCRRVYVW